LNCFEEFKLRLCYFSLLVGISIIWTSFILLAKWLVFLLLPLFDHITALLVCWLLSLFNDFSCAWRLHWFILIWCPILTCIVVEQEFWFILTKVWIGPDTIFRGQFSTRTFYPNPMQPAGAHFDSLYLDPFLCVFPIVHSALIFDNSSIFFSLFKIDSFLFIYVSFYQL
jgi:hypothetical protein